MSLLVHTGKNIANHICSTPAKSGLPQSISEGASDQPNGERVYEIMGLYSSACQNAERMEAFKVNSD